MSFLWGSTKREIFLVILLLVATCYCFFILFTKPSNTKNWTPEQNILAETTFSENEVSIKNIRNFSYRSSTDFDPGYYDATYKRGAVKNIWFVLVPFGGHQIAHAFVSFEFEDGRFLAVSVEARRENGETYSPIKGLFRKYELVYVVADERDVIGLRANHHKDSVYLYKINTSRETANKVFEDVLTRANTLAEHPEFYNTITNSCASNLVTHAKAFSSKRIPFDYRLFLPERSDEMLYDLDIIERDVPITELKERHKINSLAEKYAGIETFSKDIRSKLAK